MTQGFAKASMSATARQVGGSKATLYSYFPSKYALFAAVIQDHCERRQADLFDTFDVEGDDVAAVLQKVGCRYTHLVPSEPIVQLREL